ncbi:MAG TPA: TRAP transporter small permease subunit [Usitatibacter sp.]|nr:TRAP transporter small permease subunit [Usitatibacter sp.]
MNLERVRVAYEAALEWLVIGLMAILFSEVTLGVLYRTFGEALVWYDEVASILLAWLTFYGSALASVKRAHIGCPELMALMPAPVKLAFRVAAEVLTIGFFLLMGWMGYRVLGVLEGDTLVSLPNVPIAWVQSVVPISSVLIVAAELITLPGILKSALHGPAIAGSASQ